MKMIVSTAGLLSFFCAVALSINDMYDNSPNAVLALNGMNDQDTTRNMGRKNQHQDHLKMPPGDTTYNNRPIIPVDTISDRKWDTLIDRYPDTLRR